MHYCTIAILASTFLLIDANLVLRNDATAVFARNFSKPYVLKKTWVQNFIKFQYIFEGKQRKAKIVPLGCVPSNSENGVLLKGGDQYIAHDFVFKCEVGEDGVLNYEAVACVDALGQQMNLGESRRLSNGTVLLHCNIYGGALKKVVERVAGCYFNETVYGEDENWSEPLTNASLAEPTISLKDMVMSQEADVNSALTGRLMQCFRPHYSYYESHVVGCVIGKVALRTDEYAEVNGGTFVKCVENELGAVKLIRVDADELACHIDNATYAHGSVWNDTLRSAQMTCSFGEPIKKACLIGNERIPIGQEASISNGCIFMCQSQANVYVCDEKLGDFTIVEGTDDKPVEQNLFKRLNL